MLIVIEGVDGGGKSTLAEECATRLGARLLHLSQPKRHPLEETVLALDDYTPGSGKHVVVDRFHLGEMVYGPLYRSGSQLGELGGPQHRWIDLWLLSRGAVLCVVDAELDVLARRFAERGEDFLQTHHVEHVRDFYREANLGSYVPRPNGPVRLTKPGDTKAWARRLIDQAAELERNVERAFKTTSGRYVGRAHPSLLLVGEETSPTHLSGRRPRYRPPFVPYAGTSGTYLMGALKTTDVAIVNALEVDLEATCSALDEPNVVALGKVAHDELERFGIRHGQVPHPQYMRRFHHRRQSAYGKLIEYVADRNARFSHWPTKAEFREEDQWIWL